jgi:hypothetical protein
MNTQYFQQIAQELLNCHYGINLNDTDLSEPQNVQLAIDEGLKPYQVVGNHAETHSLVRVDKTSFYGVPSTDPINESDEEKVILRLVAANRTAEVNAKLNDRYADSIIKDKSSDFDAVEIHGVRNLHAPDDPAGTRYEIDNDDPEMISVYVHCVEGGIDCVGDFGSYVLASAYAKELSNQYNWPIYDYIDNELKVRLD